MPAFVFFWMKLLSSHRGLAGESGVKMARSTTHYGIGGRREKRKWSYFFILIKNSNQDI
jgi:hypothetical protein